MIYTFTIKSTLLVTLIAISQIASSIPKQERESNISKSIWSDYKDEYLKSHLCNKNEITLWTCEKENKTYSLCSSKEINKISGHIQYRVSDHNKITFKFPTTIRHPKGLFKYSTSANGDAGISFRNNNYIYELMDPLRTSSSLAVWKQSKYKKVANISCSNANQSLQLNYTMKLMKSAGISNQ